MKTAIRVCLAAEWLFLVAAVAAEITLEDTLPEPLGSYDEAAAYDALPWWLSDLMAASLGVMFLTAIALFFTLPKAHHLYAATNLAITLLGVFAPPGAHTSPGSALESISTAMLGATLALCYTPAGRALFAKPSLDDAGR